MQLNLAIVFLVLIAIVGYFAIRILRGHTESMFAAKASGALFDLGLDVKHLPSEAKQKFYSEAHALHTATKGQFHPKRFAMRFFGWYGVESRTIDPGAYRREGALSDSILVMKQWAKKEPQLNEAAEKEIKLIFDFLYQSFENMKAPREDIIRAQMALLEIMMKKF